MRTFPNELAEFRAIVNARGSALRAMNCGELEAIGRLEPVQLVVGNRTATVSVIVEAKPDGALRIVIQGFLENRFLPGKSVALDGFYKHADGSVSPMPDEEFYGFD